MTGLPSRVLVLLVTLPLGLVCGPAPIGRVSSDVGPGVTTPAVALEQQMMARWNAVADGRTSSINFHWSAFDRFPHPTFKFGTAEAYGEFAEVLAGFCERDDNFDFLARNDLFEMRVRNALQSGQIGIDTSFEELLLYFSSDRALGDIAIQTRSRLQAFADRLDD
jgi:hypothetical protein